MKKVISVVGARPQFVKLAPLSAKLRQYFQELIINSGQHFDENMAKVFFDQMGIPKPDYDLGISTGNQGAQTAKILSEIEVIYIREKPDYVLVFGDTNTTLAATLAASKLHVPVIHVEAGLRSFDRRMPEEQNRIVTDHLASILACPTDQAVKNLAHEGISKGVYQVGDIMFDSVKLFSARSQIPEGIQLARPFLLLTLHRPSNVDDPYQLANIFQVLENIGLQFMFPIHPRTQKNIAEFGLSLPANIQLIEPQGYLAMLGLIKQSELVFTDSGGLQKEAFFLKKRCVTLRDTTEWVETVQLGANILGLTKDGQILTDQIMSYLDQDFEFDDTIFPYGQADAADKIIESILSFESSL